MSREEQIKWLRRLLILREDPKGDTEIDVALKCAIKALEQEPCDDCISKQGVAEVLLKYANSYVGKAFAEFLVSQINALPSVTPQPNGSYNSIKTELEPCDDAVSRQAVLGLFAQNADAVSPYSKTWEEVKSLPSVTPQPKEIT